MGQLLNDASGRPIDPNRDVGEFAYIRRSDPQVGKHLRRCFELLEFRACDFDAVGDV